ncbi:uncharacterized protein LOC129940031 [Eupeodes corollae]|uniref:uncharacterized protein LOC129940031 n=1 Tax=Eupeodes corollae TaxID=290404 RepID=UPI0024921678|nr:uncharacterized protein LOC129940031 [Eupeodes corollae]
MLLYQFLSQQQKPQPFQRQQTAKLPKRNWIQRNPRTFQIVFLTTSLLTFFSKPIYDAFFADPLPGGPRVPAHRR